MSDIDVPTQKPDGPNTGEWRRATLVLGCPVCGASPGVLCNEQYQGRSRIFNRDRTHFHLARYERARELAGEPIQRSAPRLRTRAEVARDRARAQEFTTVRALLEEATRRLDVLERSQQS